MNESHTTKDSGQIILQCDESSFGVIVPGRVACAREEKPVNFLQEPIDHRFGYFGNCLCHLFFLLQQTLNALDFT
jgi:hypothetical protein